jgi:hypothetical protein
MCLPNILDVAEDNGLIINPSTFKKKEVLAKCPFCLNHKKYHLSLNVEINCFKCWYCKASGGVLEFESRLTGNTFQSVKEKYFGKDKKKRHYAEYLSPMQLRKIGWDEYKRKHRSTFLEKKDEVLRDWNAYCYDESVKHFALFITVAHLPDQERISALLEYIQTSCEKTGIYLLFSRLTEELIKDENERSQWAKEGTNLAREAWKISLENGDAELIHVLKYVLLMHYSKKHYTNPKIEKAVI